MPFLKAWLDIPYPKNKEENKMTTTQLPKQALPTGVRKRGNSYQYIVTHEGKQYMRGFSYGLTS